MTQELSGPPSCDVIILTALLVEFQALVAHLQGTLEVVHPETGTIYFRGSFAGEHRTWRVAVAEIGMGGVSAATETERAITFFRPRIILFVGIAGGLKDVRLGDVVAATKVYAYESGKAAQTFEPRPELWRGSHALVQRARHEAHHDEWLARLQDTPPDPAPRAFIGVLAAGEKVLASTQSSLYRLLKATYGDALAVEMEGHGSLQAVHANQDMHGLVIRGISDLIDGKTAADAAGSQIRAARHAAAFAFQVLAKFSLPSRPGVDAPAASQKPLSLRNLPFPQKPFFTGNEQELVLPAPQPVIETKPLSPPRGPHPRPNPWLLTAIVSFVLILSLIGVALFSHSWPLFLGSHHGQTLTTTPTASVTQIPPTTIPTNTPTSLPYPPPNWKLVINDPMKNNSNGYWPDYSKPNGACSPTGGVYQVISRSHIWYCTDQQQSFNDFALELQMKITQGTQGGIIFRINEDSFTYYSFRISIRRSLLTRYL